jgi:hypothetical protein
MTSKRFSETEQPSDDVNSEAVDEAVAAYLDRLNSGESLDPKQILVDHPGFGHEILESLEDPAPPDRARRHGRGVRGVGELDGPGGGAEGAAHGCRG